LAVVAQDIERDLLLCAATAVEDRLQDNVSDTLVSLMEADIKVCIYFKLHVVTSASYMLLKSPFIIFPLGLDAYGRQARDCNQHSILLRSVSGTPNSKYKYLLHDSKSRTIWKC
jgi:hypothetical protein